MEVLPFLVVFLLEISVASSIFLPNKINDYNGGRHHRPRSFESESSSSEEKHRRPHPHPPHHTHPPHHSLRCPDTWMQFNRTQGIWCAKVVFYGPCDQPTAENLCKAQGATLSGVQDAAERIMIADAGRVLLGQNGGGTGAIYIGARRKLTCPVFNSCDKMNTFEWTDGNTVGTAGLDWPAAEPNAFFYPHLGVQNCLMIEISMGPTGDYGYAHSQLDDQHCQTPSREYVCGKLAK